MMPGITEILLSCLVILLGPLLGALLDGIDRKISARLQGRQGPPLAQPLYDVVKLIGKERITVNQTQLVYAIANAMFNMTALVMFILQQDLLMVIFVMAFANIALIMGAMSLRGPYSKIGAQREIIQMMAYEPVLLLMCIGVYLVTGSFMIDEALAYPIPLISKLPLIFASFVFILTIKLRKSPFDFATSHHGHQELVKGHLTEFSGLQLALIEIGHWYELALLFGLLTMFFAQPIWVGMVLALICLLVEIFVDNMSARMTWQWMLRVSWIFGAGTAVTNTIWLFLQR